MAHPDFRVGNKIFATLGYPDAEWGMVKLTPHHQAELLRAAPETFHPAAGAWGRSGSTIIRLSSAGWSCSVPSCGRLGRMRARRYRWGSGGRVVSRFQKVSPCRVAPPVTCKGPAVPERWQDGEGGGNRKRGSGGKPARV
ncbi:MAG: MmcQ/YjbR family DNA-binding protein, partial [Chthoniobacterales bacterium]